MISENSKKSSLISTCWEHIGSWSDRSPSCHQLNQVRHCRYCDVFAEAAKAKVYSSYTDDNIFQQAKVIMEQQGTSPNEGIYSAIPFRMGPKWFLLPTHSVISIAVNMRAHSIPNLKNYYVKGLVSVNGEVYLCFSLSRLLSIKRDYSETPDLKKGIFERLMVINVGSVRIAIRVDEIREAIRYDETDIEKKGKNKKHVWDPYLLGSILFEKPKYTMSYLLDMLALEQVIKNQIT